MRDNHNRSQSEDDRSSREEGMHKEDVKVAPNEPSLQPNSLI
jgi:hypothetical protein